MKYTSLSFRQICILKVLNGSNVSGKEIRDKLDENNIGFDTPPAFYQLMKRLENNKLVEGQYKTSMRDDHQIIKERYYQLTKKGITALGEINVGLWSLDQIADAEQNKKFNEEYAFCSNELNQP